MLIRLNFTERKVPQKVEKGIFCNATLRKPWFINVNIRQGIDLESSLPPTLGRSYSSEHVLTLTINLPVQPTPSRAPAYLPVLPICMPSLSPGRIAV